MERNLIAFRAVEDDGSVHLVNWVDAEHDWTLCGLVPRQWPATHGTVTCPHCLHVRTVTAPAMDRATIHP